MEETENTIQTDLKEKKPHKPKKKFFERRSGWFILGGILVVVILAIGGATGAARGINDRLSVAETQAAPRIQSQLDGARQDIEEGRYEVALGRLDWILEEMTEFLTEEELAEIGELYSQTLLKIETFKTPTPQPSPTPTVPAFTPTPDLRDVEELFATAQQQIEEGAWDEAIESLKALREKDLTFRTIQVDGMLYIALRNRGIQKILVDGSLEPGIYDLTLAERFAPLDSRAEGLRTWTRLYLTGASYWDVDWSQVVYYFSQVYPHLPNLRDGTFMTATERYRIGVIEYAEQLALARDFCLSQEYFGKALEISEDPFIRARYDDAGEDCQALTAPVEQPTVETVTPIPEQESASTPIPTAEPTQEQTEALTEEPTAEPTEEPTAEPTEETTEEPVG